MRHPADFALFAWRSGWVFALRSARLAVEPAEAAASLAAMALEKQRACAEGWLAASRAALRGADAGAVAAAALAPARRRVSANHRALTRPFGADRGRR
ncbi:hypothetical protein [Caldovatus aquaticus]|uniref:Antifreeze protein n=1 Tax=Caldovatus aquaticus TaxID=2865671 RepID=A0ABS7F5Z6_9PROT|nr:hypothetical protein [Caldovatus aquaticus]MBW8270382.1 hypothetical protein [Caldovatus aquaticus]